MGKMKFIADGENGHPAIEVEFLVPAGSVERVLVAFADYFGPTFVDANKPDAGNRPRTPTELVEAWSKQCMGDALNLVHGYETRVAAEKAMNAVEKIETL